MNARHGNSSLAPQSLVPGPAERLDFFKRKITDAVFLPVFVVEVPPFVFVDRKAFGFHGFSEKLAIPALSGPAYESRWCVV